MVERHFESAVGIGRIALRLQDNTRVEVRGAVGAVSRSFMGKYDVGFASAVEMLGKRLFNTFANVAGKRCSYIDLFARNPNLHESRTFMSTMYGIFASFGSRLCRWQTLPKKAADHRSRIP